MYLNEGEPIKLAEEDIIDLMFHWIQNREVTSSFPSLTYFHKFLVNNLNISNEFIEVLTIWHSAGLEPRKKLYTHIARNYVMAQVAAGKVTAEAARMFLLVEYGIDTRGGKVDDAAGSAIDENEIDARIKSLLAQDAGST